MTAKDELTGVYVATVTTASGRTLTEAGDELYLDDFLSELARAEEIIAAERHEMTEAELIEFGPVWDSPGTSEEGDDRLDDEDA